jgi:hypothetical protein
MLHACSNWRPKLVADWQSICLGEEHKQIEVASNAKRTLFEAMRCWVMLLEEKNANLIYEVVLDVRFGHQLANREFWITKLPCASVLVTL